MNFGDYMLSNSKSQSALELDQELRFAQLLIDRVADAAFCISSEGRFLYVNNAFCTVTGYSREELLLMSLQDIDIDFVQRNWRKQWARLKKQRYLSFKSRYQARTGRLFLADIKISYVEHEGREFGCVFAKDGSGKLIEMSMQRYIGRRSDTQEELAQEVIEYQKTETELEISLSLLQATLDSAANGILAVNFEGEVLCYNRKFMDMWQLPESIELSRKSSQAQAFFMSKVKDPEFFLKAIWEMPIESDEESYDLVELKDGRVFAHYSEPQKLDNKIIGRVWSIWDITESKRTEEALRLNESRFRALAETTEASIFLVHNGCICYANPAAEILTGYERQELLKNFEIKRLIKGKKLRQVSKQDGVAYCEYQEMQIITKSGTERWLACTVGLLDGVLDFSNCSVELVTAIDITDYKQAETEVRLALEQAKRLSELRERFVSMLCHQFRTPLNVVSFSADLLKRHIHQWTEEKNRSYLDLIQVAVQQISELLDEILLYGQAESSRLQCNPRALNLDRFCRDIIAQIQLAGGNQKLINFIPQGSCTTAYLDPKLLQHILSNLLSNAVKYSSSNGTVDLEIYCKSKEVIFKIKDSGIGIPVVDQQQIFEPFYRGSNIDNIPGTGLGLSIVKTLIELHGGEISVESVVGAGTTFTVSLPSREL
ncbi:MAG: PAS domain S-box protein [Scytonema sp. PMC 1069.18]|nr:PAS domain S-box protein [Scytonema sp. PMC 1069.18]MEC4883765.1 PAS domain S-box protein [Scytonema sp. PMC 1070.18]